MSGFWLVYWTGRDGWVGGVLGVLNGWHFFSGDSDSLLALFVQTRASLETWHIIRGGRKGGR